MTDIKQALVIGATGNIGTHVVRLLHDRGLAVRAMARHPDGLPEGVEAVPGDLMHLETLRTALAGADAVFLLWPFPTADGAPAVVEAIAGAARRVVYVSAMSVRDDRPAAENGVWGQVEDAIRRTGIEYTFLRASGFATNTLQWAPAIRTGQQVRVPYLAAARSLIHEQDIAEIAVLAMTEPGHANAAYNVTGPTTITQAEQIRILGEVAGRPAHAEEASLEEARTAMLSWADPAFADAALRYWASLVDTPEPTTSTVEELTGTPARTFAQWARDHAGDFRPIGTPEVAERYVSAFRSGQMDVALRLASAGMVRIAPLETNGERVEVRGLADIMANGEQLTADLVIHHVEVQGPFVGGDQFAVRFTFDQTHTSTGNRTTTTKMSLYTVADGEIVREEVHYFDPASS
jgi:uncharacterized protein YbjT (DUF2867 family)